jgi:hypothetical protein
LIMPLPENGAPGDMSLPLDREKFYIRTWIRLANAWRIIGAVPADCQGVRVIRHNTPGSAPVRAAMARCRNDAPGERPAPLTAAPHGHA